MWLFTTIGFFSVVQKPNQANLTVRAHVAADLDRLRELYLPELGPTEPETVDYPYRASVEREAIARCMSNLVNDINYSDFQTEVVRLMGFSREHVYSAVWDELHQLEEDPR